MSAAEDEKSAGEYCSRSVAAARKALIENAAARDGKLFLYALLTVMN